MSLLEVKELILSVANLKHRTPDSVADEESLFQGGLGLDSIDVLELAVELDKKYGLKVKNTEVGRKALQNPLSIWCAIQDHQSTKPFLSSEGILHATTDSPSG